ncbi:MAG: hypothetical protein ACD_76C00102G0001, partial [uncultured bacterium]
MNEIKFKNKYRIMPARHPCWNYGGDGWYFITICTKNRAYCFGNIIDGEMQLSKIGKIISNEWTKTERMRSYVKLDEWTVMPNHIHGIITINKTPVVVPVELMNVDSVSDSVSVSVSDS